MDNFRRWLKGRPPVAQPSREVAPPPTTGLSRAGRAGHVTQMQADVSRLQQEILALSNDATGRPGGSAAPGSDPRMSGLEQELDKAQRELARYQARV